MVGDLLLETAVARPTQEQTGHAFAKGMDPGHQPSCVAARSTRSTPPIERRHHAISASSCRWPDRGEPIVARAAIVLRRAPLGDDPTAAEQTLEHRIAPRPVGSHTRRPTVARCARRRPSRAWPKAQRLELSISNVPGAAHRRLGSSASLLYAAYSKRTPERGRKVGFRAAEPCIPAKPGSGVTTRTARRGCLDHRNRR